MIDRIRRVYRRTRRYSDLNESPKERLIDLTAHLFAGRELPLIMIGISISLTVTSTFGDTPWEAAAWSWGFFALSLLVYVGAQEVIHAAKAASQEFGDNEADGIH